jgi:Cellulase (glycosyl hydrolase family 5)
MLLTNSGGEKPPSDSLRLRNKAKTVAAPLLAALAFTSLAKAERMLDHQETDPMIGIVENNVLSVNPSVSKSRMNQIKQVGANTVRVNIMWGHGTAYPDGKEMQKMKNASAAAEQADVRLFASFYPQPGELNNDGRATPLGVSQQRQFCDFVDRYYRSIPNLSDIEIGNEPNSTLFWQPQYGPDGKSRSPESYVSLLARCYDTLKRTASEQGRTVTVYGPGLASKGNADPRHQRPSHPPKDFLLKMGQALRDSGRTRPIMDVLTVHPYEESNASSPNREERENSTTIGLADSRVLRKVIEKAFTGTGQPIDVPVLYNEFGVQTTIPESKVKPYSKTENIIAVDPDIQGEYLREAVEMAYCQGAGLFTFLSVDEPDLTRWQSGLRYLDGTPKSSAKAFRAVIQEVQTDNIDCKQY